MPWTRPCANGTYPKNSTTSTSGANGSYTNYAREPFRRYVNTNLEGDYFYDLYGRLITRGWLIYDHTQRQPQNQFGNSLFKDSRFSGWFSSLLVASDSKGQYHYSLSIGQQLRTVLTPLTFAKAQFDGLQWDLASDKYPCHHHLLSHQRARRQ